MRIYGTTLHFVIKYNTQLEKYRHHGRRCPPVSHEYLRIHNTPVAQSRYEYSQLPWVCLVPV